MASLKKLAVSGIKWTGLSAAIVNVLQFLQLAVLARLLDPADFGLMAMVMVVIGFAQTFGDMGVSNAIIYHRNSTSEQLSSLYWLSIFTGIALFSLILGCAPLVASFYDEPRLRGLIAWTALTFLIAPLGQQFHALLEKELQFDRITKIDVFSTCVSVAIAILSAIVGQGVYALVWGQLVRISLRTFFLAWIGWHTWRPLFHFRQLDLKGYLAFGLYQMGERNLYYLVMNMDKVLIGRLLGSKALGFYSIAYQLMSRPMLTLDPVINRVAFPLFSTIQQDDTRLKRGYLKIIESVAFVQGPIHCGMFAVATPLMTLLLGTGWEPAINVFQILIWLGIFYSLSHYFGSLLLAKGRADLEFWWTTVDLLIYIIAILIGFQWDLQGVAWALLIVTVLILFPIEFWVRWYLVKMRPAEFLNKVLPWIALSIFMAVGVRAVDHGISIENLGARLSVLVTVGMIIYLSGMLLLKKSFLHELISLVIAGKEEEEVS